VLVFGIWYSMQIFYILLTLVGENGLDGFVAPPPAPTDVSQNRGRWYFGRTDFQLVGRFECRQACPPVVRGTE
jgi:hypothetical protein